MPIRRILVAIDASPSARRTLAYAFELAQLADAQLTVLAVGGRLPAAAATVGEVQDEEERRTGVFAALSEQVFAEADERGTEVDLQLEHGTFAHVLERHAGNGDFDLVVIGVRGGLAHWLRGPHLDRLSRRLPCPVLAVR